MPMNVRPKLKTFYRTLQRIENWPTAVGLRMSRARTRLRLLSFRNGMQALVRGGTHDWDVISELALADAYSGVLDHLRALPGQPLVLDLGANIGIFSLLAAMAHPQARIIAYEPGPPNLRMLELNRLANHSLSERIEVRSEALGGETRTAEFFYDEANPPASGLWYGRGKPFRVQIRSFTQVLESLPGPVDIAKVDIEGAEYEILEKTPAELWRLVSLLCIEVHDDPSGKLTVEGYLRRMAEYGYTHRIQPVGSCTYLLQRST